MNNNGLPLHPESALAHHEYPCIAAQGFSVADLCRRWKVGADKIHGFIRRGELFAINVASRLSARPQWRVTLESVELFEQRRSSVPLPNQQRRRQHPQIVDFYPD